jgi:hypothetical protein
MAVGAFPWWYPRRTHEAWAKVRRKGARRFVFVKGGAMYGGLMFLFTALVSPYVRGATDMLTPAALVTNAAVWIVAGLAWGALTWHFCERNFLKFEKHSGTPQT